MCSKSLLYLTIIIAPRHDLGSELGIYKPLVIRFLTNLSSRYFPNSPEELTEDLETII